MAGMKTKRVLLIGWAATATSFIGAMGWEALLHYFDWKNAPPGWIVDSAPPRALVLMVLFGFYGLIVMTLISLFWFVLSKASK
jgi:hypothetical protein